MQECFCNVQHLTSLSKSFRFLYRHQCLFTQSQSFCSLFQTPSTSCRLDLGSLSQELRVHLNHWSCLFSKVQSDHFLRRAAGQHTRLLLKIKESLDLLGLQALVLMEHYVQAILSSVFQTDLDSVPKEVLEDILTGTYHYNQVVDEQRGQHSASKLKTAVMQQAHFSTLDSSLPRIKSHRPSPFSVKELMMILASYHAEMAAKQLHYWASEPPCYFCQIHSNHETCTCAQNPTSLSCGISTLRSEWTWEQLHYTYLISSPLFSISRPTLQMSCQNKNTTLPVYTPDVHLNKPVVENRPSVSANPADTEHKEENSKREQSNRCQKRTSHSAFTQSGVEALDLVQPGLESGALLQTASPLLMSSQRLRGVPPSRIFQLQRSSAELLFQVFVSSSDLLAPLVSHTPTPERLNEQPLQTPATDVVNGKVDSTILSARVPNTPDPVELDRESSKLNKDQNVERIQQEWAELEITVPDPTSRYGHTIVTTYQCYW